MLLVRWVLPPSSPLSCPTQPLLPILGQEAGVRMLSDSSSTLTSCEQSGAWGSLCLWSIHKTLNFREQHRELPLLSSLSFSPQEQLFSLCFTAWVVVQICVLPVSTLACLLWLDPLKKWGETRFLRVIDLKDREILSELKRFQRQDKNWQASAPPGFGK